MTYGCHNRKDYVPTYIVGYRQVKAEMVPVRVTNTGTRDCQFTKTALGQVDPGCEGCRWKLLPAQKDLPF